MPDAAIRQRSDGHDKSSRSKCARPGARAKEAVIAASLSTNRAETPRRLHTRPGRCTGDAASPRARPVLLAATVESVTPETRAQGSAPLDTPARTASSPRRNRGWMPKHVGRSVTIASACGRDLRPCPLDGTASAEWIGWRSELGPGSTRHRPCRFRGLRGRSSLLRAELSPTLPRHPPRPRGSRGEVFQARARIPRRHR